MDEKSNQELPPKRLYQWNVTYLVRRNIQLNKYFCTFYCPWLRCVNVIGSFVQTKSLTEQMEVEQNQINGKCRLKRDKVPDTLSVSLSFQKIWMCAQITNNFEEPNNFVSAVVSICYTRDFSTMTLLHNRFWFIFHR